MGDQNTGKSSPIERMSETKVPRNADTCTRCPIELNLTESGNSPGICHVYLVKEDVFEGKMGSRQTGATNPKPPGRGWYCTSLRTTILLHSQNQGGSWRRPSVGHSSQL